MRNHTAPIGTGEKLALAAILAIAAGLRFWKIGGPSLWFDEGMTMGIVRLGWVDMLQVIARREINMALYYVLLKPWIAIAHSETWIRSLSAIFAIATVAAVWWLGRRMMGPIAGLIAALLLALNAFHVHYSQEARGYALLGLLVALATTALVNAVDSGTPRAWRWYTELAALAVYAHVYAGLILLAQWIWLATTRRLTSPARRSILLTCFLLLPAVASALAVGSGPIQWVPKLTWTSFGGMLADASGGGVALLVIIGLAALLAMARPYAPEEASPRRDQVWLLLVCTFLPVAVLAIGSLLRPMLVARYLTVCLPTLVLLVVAGLGRFPAIPRVLVVAAMAGLSILGVVRYEAQPLLGHDDWRSASRYVFAHARPGDSAFFYTTPGRAAFDYYRWLDKQPADVPVVVYPAHDEPYRDLISEPLAERIDQAGMDHPRLWLVLNQFTGQDGKPDFAARGAQGWIGRFYVEQSRAAVPGLPRIEVVLYEHR